MAAKLTVTREIDGTTYKMETLRARDLIAIVEAHDDRRRRRLIGLLTDGGLSDEAKGKAIEQFERESGLSMTMLKIPFTLHGAVEIIDAAARQNGVDPDVFMALDPSELTALALDLLNMRRHLEGADDPKAEAVAVTPH